MRRCGTRRDWMLIGTMAVITGAGCSGDFDYGETGRVSGRLTFEGKPLVAGHGVIIMEPAKGYLAYGETDSDGRYEVNSWNNGDMPVGTYKVRIGGPPAPPPPTDLTAEEAFDHPELVDPQAPPIVFPKKYLDENSSGLTFEVQPGSNTYDIDLKNE